MENTKAMTSLSLESFSWQYSYSLYKQVKTRLIIKEKEKEKIRKKKTKKEMKKAQLVIAPAPGVGHITSTIELAKRIVDRDDRLSVTVLIMAVPNEPSLSAYAKSLSTSVTGVQFIDLPPVEPPSREIYKAPESFISIFIQNHKPHVKKAITELTESNSVPLAGLVMDLFSTSMIDVANELGCPSYIYFTSAAGSLGVMLHLPILHTQITTEFNDSETEIIVPSFTNSVPPEVLPSVLLNKKDDGYTWAVSHGQRLKEVKGIIVNSFFELEPYAFNSFLDGFAPPVYSVGPLIDHRSQTHFSSDQAQVHDQIMKWLDDQPPKSVVFLCFGSLGSFGADQVKEMAIGLEKSGHRFLWSLRRPAEVGERLPRDYTNPEEVLPNGFLDQTKERGLVCGWVPQVRVMAHKAIGGFVSHCGWNSILESLWCGVPILTWPLYAEQQSNAFEMVKELGLAVELKLDSRRGGDLVKAEELEKGIKCLMREDNEVRRRVKEMGEKSREVLMDGGSSFESLGRLIDELVGHEP